MSPIYIIAEGENMKWFRNENGQSAVELAITLPILLSILCGIIDFGWIFMGQLAVNNCAREGARYAIANSSRVDLSSKTFNKVFAIANSSIKNNIQTTVTLSNTTRPREGDVTVKVTSRINILTFVASAIYQSETAPLSASVTMKAE